MKRLFSVAIIICGMLCALPAQSQLIRFGVKGGLNETKASFSSSNRTGEKAASFYFGPVAEVKVPFLGFGVDGALLYSQTGIKAEDNSKTVYQREIDIPLNLKYTIGSSMAGIFLFAGPQFGFNIDKNESDKNSYHDYSFKTANLSVNLGIGFKLFKHLQISGNYNLPLTDGADYSNTVASVKNESVKNKTWQVGAAWFF
jgi:hypothetical protein